MSASLQDFFATYKTRPVSRECYKQLGALLQKCPAEEVEHFLLSYHPAELHLQLLRALAARALGSLSLLLEGIRSDSKEVSKFCAQSASLFSSKNGDLYDPNILLPLLQAVSYATRNKILSNLARHMTNGNDEIADRLFESIADLWGPATATPLLCRTSKVLIQRELKNGHLLSSFQILTITQRYPELGMTLLENVSLGPFSLKAARIVVRNNLPESLNYCLNNRHQNLLSKSTMRLVLRNHKEVIMLSPSEWTGILDIECVKKVLKPETFELFVLRQVERQLKDRRSVSCYSPCYIEQLSPKAVSTIMQKVDWEQIEDFWENHESLLKLLDTVDRNRIASEIFEKTKSLDWVTYMSCDRSIPILRESLSSEAKAHVRASLVEKLLKTVEINKDNQAFEDICELVAVRYRNDRDVLNSFLEYLPDMTSASEKIWTLVYSLGVKYVELSNPYFLFGISRLFSAALKRNGKSGLKIYIDRLIKQRRLIDSDKDLTELDAELRDEFVSLIFTSTNVDSDDSDIVLCLLNLLPVVSKWNASLPHPIRTENVDNFVLRNLDKKSAIDFVLNKFNRYPLDCVEKCFEETGNPDLLEWMVRKNPERLTPSRAAVEKIADKFIDRGCWQYIKLLKALKNKGYLDILKYLCDKSLAAIRDPDRESRRHAIILLSITAANTDEYLQEVSKFFVDLEVGQELASPFLSHPKPTDCQDQENILKQSQQKDSIYKGIGNSFSFIDTPTVIVDMLMKFCINGDMMLYVRDSVYAVSLSLPIARTMDLLSLLVQKPVSVMKHALRIHQLVSDIKTQSVFLTKLAQTETHLTLRTCLFEYALSSLDNTKNVDIWEAVKEMMSRLTPKDKALLAILRGKKVPLQFWEEYLKLLLGKTEALEDVTIENVSNILDKICASIGTMPISNQFHENLIKRYFLSNRYFPCLSWHISACNLLVTYLQQGMGNDLQADVEHKKLLILELLDSAASKEMIGVYDTKLGYHPTTALLDQFVQLFSSISRHQQEHGVANNDNNLSIFIDTLLSFFVRINENLLFGPLVCLSLTDITCRKVNKTSESAGYLVGQFIDRVYAENVGLARHALPIFVESYFTGKMLDASFLQDILQPPHPLNSEMQMIRQIIVTTLLPSNWRKEKSLELFRENYMASVRNTPSEVIAFANEI